MEIEQHIELAINGDPSSIDIIVKHIQQDIFNLALRMLVDHDDAADATQEILIKVLTHLSAFKFKSKFRTWVYRIATNYLLTEKKVLAKQPNLSFEDFKSDLESDLTPTSVQHDVQEYDVMLNELRIHCTLAMLLCLSPPQRMAFILGEIFELDHQEASEILNVQPATYRQQLSRGRNALIKFTADSCGLVSNTAKCQCPLKLTGAMARGCVNNVTYNYAKQEQLSYCSVKEQISKTQQELKSLASFKSIKQYPHYVEFSHVLESVLNSNKAKGIPLRFLS